MTRSRVKAIHDKVTSLLSMCDFDTPLNGLLLHSDTLCILRCDPHEDLQGSVEDGQESSQEEEDETKLESGGTTDPDPVLPRHLESVLPQLLPHLPGGTDIATIHPGSTAEWPGTTVKRVLPGCSRYYRGGRICKVKRALCLVIFSPFRI